MKQFSLGCKPGFERTLYRLSVMDERRIPYGPYDGENVNINKYFLLWHQSMEETKERVLNMLDRCDGSPVSLARLRRDVEGMYE